MRNIAVALAQVEWLGSRQAMMDQYRTMLNREALNKAEIICLPEFSLLPYFPGTREPSGFEWAEALPGGESEQFFAHLAHDLAVTVIGSLFERTSDGALYDTATIHAPDGSLSGFTRKVHIPYGEGYNETDFFGGGVEYPVHDIGAVRIAAPTCYDQWFPETARISALNGAEFIFYPTAIGSEPTDAAIDTQEAWTTVMRGHAISNGVYIGAANRVGVENGVTFYGSSFVCDPTGRILAQAGRDTVEVITATLDAHTFEHWRALFPLLRQRVPSSYGRLIVHDSTDVSTSDS